MVIERVSPGVYTRIVDLSEFVRNVPSTIGFLPIISEKGRDNELILTNRRDFIPEFGQPNINYLDLGYLYNQGPYIAANFLDSSDDLYVIRCMPTDAKFANLVINSAAGVIGITASLAYDRENDIETTISGALSSGTGNLAVIYGRGRGSYYNNLKIDITKPRNTQLAGDNVYVLDVYELQERDNTTAFIRAFDGDSTSDLTYSIVETFEVSFNPDKLDLAGQSMWIEDVINSYSKLIKCKASTTNCKTQYGGSYIYESDFSYPFTNAIDVLSNPSGSIALSNGSDGNIDPANSNITTARANASSMLVQAYDGTLPKNTTSTSVVDEVVDTEAVYFSLVFAGGYPYDVQTAAIDLSRTLRKDCITIFDIGDKKNFSEADAYSDNHNTMYAARYTGYHKIFDQYTARDIWVSPVYQLAKVIPENDKVGEIWYAPAGFNRGICEGVKELRFSPNLSQRENLYLAQVNPLVKFSVGGVVVFGQLTTQTKTSSLQDVNVVRLILYMKRALEQFCRNYLFEQNDQTTWNQIQSNVEGFLKEIQNRRGLDKFSVDVGATDYEKKLKRVHVNINVTPTKAVEQIYLTFFVNG